MVLLYYGANNRHSVKTLYDVFCMLVKTASQMTMEENHKYSSPKQQIQGYV